jgi:antirestriction protein
MNHEPLRNNEATPPLEPPVDESTAAPAEQREAEPAIQPRIWVASLSDYNNGILHGQWIDAAQDETDLQTAIDTMLAASPWTAHTGGPAEEWAIHDHDGFAPLRIDEHEDLSWISRVAKGIAEHGLAFAAYADVVAEEALLASFDKDYLGHYDDLHAYIEQLVNDLGYDRILDEALPASIRPYVKIDITATANDLLLGGDLQAIPAPDGGVWIFRG